jgi:hypothetical protein
LWLSAIVWERAYGQARGQGSEAKFELPLDGDLSKLVEDATDEWKIGWPQTGELAAPIGPVGRLGLMARTWNLPPQSQ